MVIALSLQSFWELFEETDETQQRFDPSDELDVIWKFPKQLGEGWYRRIQLLQEQHTTAGS